MNRRVSSFIGEIMLRSPAGLNAIKKVPLFGSFVRQIGRHVVPPDEYVWARILRGLGKDLWLELNPRTGGNYFDGTVEPTVQLALAEHLHPGMTFYDLGANIGLFTLLAARIVGDHGRVYSFEPDGEAIARLKKNVEKNQFTNITVVNAGAWSSSGMVEFLPADSSSPDRGVGRFSVTEERHASIPTRCVALDDFIKNAYPPDAIKCDVEGAEVEVLRGAHSLLRTHRPWIIIELHSKEIRAGVQRLLSSYGYSLVDIDDSHMMAFP